MSSDQTKQPDLDQEISKEEKLEQEKAKNVIWGHNTYFSGVVPIVPDYCRSL